MSISQLASKIAKMEGKKSQVKIGDIREILKILVKDSILFDELTKLHAQDTDKLVSKLIKQNKKKVK